jgi:XTP/dITP diphosphohydrolase
MELVFATNNLHKLNEIRLILGDRFIIKSLEDIGCRDEIPENQATLEGNATQKAFYLYNRYRLDCFADDTGLEVEALNGEPGVYSARYAGIEKDSEANIRKLLERMAEINNRRARFRTMISLVVKGEEKLFEGVTEGVIIRQKRGAGGFGYDPVFVPDGSDLTFAEMDLSEKNRISHRGRAVRMLAEYLKHLEV